MGREQKTYKEYPDSYFEMLEHFQTSSEDWVVERSFRELSSLRHRLYRFFKALQEEVVAGRADEYVLGLLKVKRNLSVSLLPVRAKGEEPAVLRIQLETLTSVLKEKEEK